MNRKARRAAERRRGGLPPLCVPGTHRFGEVRATVGDKVTERAIICSACRRTIQQVFEQSPRDLAIYRKWLEQQLDEVEHTHELYPALGEHKPEVDGCPGCIRRAQLQHASPESLGAKVDR